MRPPRGRMRPASESCMHDSAGRRMRHPGPWRMRQGLKIPYAARCPPSKAVLITGCSSGIGEATRKAAGRPRLERLRQRADARSRSSTSQAPAASCCSWMSATRTRCARRWRPIEREHGAVGVLVNNAGYSQGGPIEQVPLEAVRRQFETNVFGLIALTQLVLPAMRAQHWGKVVNVGSMGGKLTLPGGGLYHATKHSLEAISDALRFEVRGFGVDVVLIEPGLITTEFGKTAAATVNEAGANAQAENGPAIPTKSSTRSSRR